MSFQEKNKINHLLFMDALKLYSRNEKVLNWLVPTIRGFNDDIGMEFSKEKCAMLLVIEKGNIVKSVVNSVGKVVHWKLAKKVILKLEMSGMKMIQKVFWRMKIINLVRFQYSDRPFYRS